MAAVGASSNSSLSGTSATSDDNHDNDVLMANDTITVCINERHKTYMQACCLDGACLVKFKELDIRILDADPQPLFSNIHMNENGICISSVPLTNKEASRLYAELLLCVCWHTEHI